MDLYRVSLMLFCIAVLLTGCARQTLQLTQSGGNFSKQQREWEQDTSVPLLSGMGEHHHAISAQHPGAQHYFNQALVLSFAYNHAESVRAFRAAQKLDDRCAMCYWGEALALGPNINVTHHGKVVMDEEVRVRAFAAIQKAIALKHYASEKERDYIDALATRYNGDVSTTRDQLDQAYMEAMRDLSEKYPQDDDAATLYAESMMNLMPWDYWLDPDTPKALTVELIDVLEKVLKRSPRHPLGIHLYIHAVESSSNPGRAEKAADILLDLVPGAGHLVHMPSHTYWRIGRYSDAAKANMKAVAVDEAYIAACNAKGFYPAAYYPHNLHFLWAAYSMEGRSQDAIETARKVAESISEELVTEFPVVEFYKTIPLLSLTGFGKWQEILAEPQPPVHRVFTNAIRHYARAMAHIRLGHLDAAHEEYTELIKLKADARITALDELDYPASSILHIADQLITGEVLMTQGKLAQAITALEKAVAIQDGLPYMEPPYWYYPTRQALGKALLDSGDFARAEMIYRENLKNYPKNGWGLFGLMQSLEAQGKSSDEIKKAFERAWRHADVVLQASRF
ncbi:MAG: hypothetical protein H6936_03280 [Burkholderiales bacterium]|nr:hypothetical protein [Nitrosomonas sp.]MCP5273876.1 hypothetical protein [Burkholderiales bacterium]